MNVKVMLVKPAGRHYQVRFRDGEKMRAVSTGTSVLAEAQAIQAEWQARLTLGLMRPKKRRPGVITWDDFRVDYRETKLLFRKPKTYAAATSRLNIAAAIVQPKSLSDMANMEALTHLQNALLRGDLSRYNRPRSKATVLAYLRDVMVALRWAHRRGYISTVPSIEMVQPPQNPMKGRPLLDDEVQRFIQVVPEVLNEDVTDSWTYLIRGMLASGLRLGETMNLSWTSPETIQPLWLPGMEPVLRFPASTQKNGKSEDISMPPDFEDVLRETPESDRDGYVFNPQSVLPRYDQRLSPLHIGKVLSRIGMQANIRVGPKKFASAHDLRRTAARNLANGGVLLEDVRHIMRHSSTRVTERYYAKSEAETVGRRMRETLRPRSGNTVTKNQASETERKPLQSSKCPLLDSNQEPTD